ncbi:MAG: tetratricopeptide repeat protein [Pyrinomonadaceae bacterium]
MRPAQTLIIIALLGVLFGNASAPARAAKDSWTRVQSSNFQLVGNASEKEIRKVGAKLEQFREVMRRLITKANFSTPVPSTVVVFKSDDSFKPYKPLYQGKAAPVGGYFQAGEDVNYIALATSTAAESPYRIIFHEYAHLLVNNNIRNVPAWFNEGLAEYYSTFEVADDRKAELGRVIPSHVFLLREKWIPLRDLFAVDHASALYNERNKQSIFYAESWALVHYLLLGKQGQRQPQLGVFLGKLEAGASPDAAFQQAFGIDLPSFEKELRAYVNRSSYPTLVFTFGQKLEFDTNMQAAPISEAEAKTYLGDLLLHTNRLADGERHLREALTLDANLAQAHASLGMTLMRQNQADAARASLERAVSLNTSNYLAHYYYASALSQQAYGAGGLVTSFPPKDAERMRAELKKAIELRPDFPESYHLLAFISVVTGEQLDEAVSLLVRALKISPGRERYRTMLAQVYLRREDPQNARRILEPLARGAADEQQRNHAQGLLKRVETLEAYQAHVQANAQANARTTTARETSRPGLLAQAESSEPPVKEAEQATEVDQEAVRKKVEEDTLREVLRRPAAGEQQFQGVLTRIECRPRDVLLSFQAGARTIKLTSRKFEDVDFTTFTTETAGQISCGPRKLTNHVVVIYQPAPNARAQVDGEVISVSLVPKDFLLVK